jgi:hypothetical protein
MAAPRPKYLDTVAAYLAEQEQKKAQPEVRRVFTHTPEGIRAAVLSPTGATTASYPEDAAAGLEGSGYEFLSGDEFASAQPPQRSAMPPPGKLPFISGTPTHQGKPGTSMAPPPTGDQGMASAMSLAATAARRTGAPPPPLPAPTTAPATSTKKHRQVDVSLASSGPQPTLRPYQPLSEMAAPPQDRLASLPPAVATYMRNRSGLEVAQEDANRRAMAVELASAANQFGSGLAGARYDDGAWKNQRAAAGQPVADYLAREEEERQQQQDERAAHEAAAAAEMELKKFQRLQGRDKAEDTLARARMQNERDIADARLREGSLDRGMRREEMRLRQKEGEELKRSMAEQKRQDMLGRQDEKDLQALGQATAKAPFGEFQQALEEVDRLAPGLAYGQAPAQSPMGVGDRFARSIPFGMGNWAVSDEGQRYGQAISNLRDLVSRMRSGAVLNAGEERHYMSLLGDEVFSDPRRAAAGIDAVRTGVAQKLRNAQGAYSVAEPGQRSTLDKYEGTGATTFRAPIFGAAPTGEEIEMPNGDVYQVLKDGTTRKVLR